MNWREVKGTTPHVVGRSITVEVEHGRAVVVVGGKIKLAALTSR